MAKRVPATKPEETDTTLNIPDADVPTFEVVERRILHGDAEALSGPSLELIGQSEPMKLYWGNTGRDGRHFQLTKRKGWVPVKMSELANRLDIGGEIVESPEGIVARGEKGREVLYKMPLRLYRALAQRKADDNIRRSRSAARLKQGSQDSMVRDADSGSLGASERERLLRGADRMNRMTVDLTESTEAVELES
jgi:hypothetical protein